MAAEDRYNGIINVYKEKGYTSSDVVAVMRGILHQRKAGHTGTLDPEAEGVLPICVGSGTKLCEELTGHDKEYIAVMRLGVSTDTQDMTGNVICTHRIDITEQDLRCVILSFKGGYSQIPPMYSAVKVNGKRLYELARKGREVERRPRQVGISEIEVLGIELPLVRLRVVCSKGTYIRTLCSDIGDKAGCGAAMDSLLRTRVGAFRLSDAHRLAEITALAESGAGESILISVEKFYEDLPEIQITDEAKQKLINGNSFGTGCIGRTVLHGTETGRARIYDKTGFFYGIYALGEDGIWHPEKMFLCNGMSAHTDDNDAAAADIM